jgi:Rrf2 family transcriptional regulator, iron-sulfur cluster assembly transcription factor
MILIRKHRIQGGYFRWRMVFSKSFGYALRGILYIALMAESKSKIQLDEMAEKLAVPRFFLGKIMNRLVHDGILKSEKGHKGGFSITERTMQVTLLDLFKITGDGESFDTCVLRLRKCNSVNPCPLNYEIESLRTQWHRLLAETSIDDLLKKDQPDFLKSIATVS